MFVLGQTPSQMLVAGTDTGADAMLKHAGLQNAFSGVRGYRPVSTEAIIAAQPDLVVLTQPDALTPGNGSNSRSLIHQFKGLSATPAARPGRWLVFDTMFLLSFGPRLPDAILTLRRASIEAMRT
jgi:iron complex transport system substrate-binding protein